jgi:hypothetical protein
MPVFEKPVLDPEMRGRSNKVRRAAAAVEESSLCADGATSKPSRTFEIFPNVSIPRAENSTISWRNQKFGNSGLHSLLFV